MNLALQTRRAVITLSLMALAMVCVAAKTATRTRCQLSADALRASKHGCADRSMCRPDRLPFVSPSRPQSR